MIKHILSDFYNTLIDNEESIDSDTIIEIDKFRRNKGIFSICTDLNYEEVLYYDKSFHFIDYIISYSGSIVYDNNKEKIIYNKNILISKIKKLIKQLSTTNIILYSINTSHKLDNQYEEYLKNNKIYRIDIINNKDNLKIVKELELNYYENNNKIIITGSNIIDSINKINKNKISNKETLCIPYDNKFIDCIKIYNCIGLSNTILNIKKITKDNNKNGVLDIITSNIEV